MVEGVGIDRAVGSVSLLSLARGFAFFGTRGKLWVFGCCACLGLFGVPCFFSPIGEELG